MEELVRAPCNRLKAETSKYAGKQKTPKREFFVAAQRMQLDQRSNILRDQFDKRRPPRRQQITRIFHPESL
jgi:hypothetical protein